MINEALRKVVDPRTVRVTPAAKAIVEQAVQNGLRIDEHRRQLGKNTMDAGQNHFFQQYDHFLKMFKLEAEQKKLARKFSALETRALLGQLVRNIFGFSRLQSQSFE